jgi:PHD/YefM family antitoxin component YafN of YafNO toxin-antitoxin module
LSGTEMDKLRASQTRIPPDTFSRVAYQRERVRIERRGGKPVYLVSQEDLELLEMLEDRYWADEARKALDAHTKSGRKAVPWEEIKARLGL